MIRGQAMIVIASVASVMTSLSVMVDSQSCSKPHKDLLPPLQAWVDTLPALRNQDRRLDSVLEDLIWAAERQDTRDEELVSRFYMYLSLPYQTVCSVGKVLGLSRWHPNCGATDGQRFLCMDGLFEDIRADRCIVYSFGLADNWKVEEELASMGCKVFAYDPSVDGPPQPPSHPNIHFRKVGLSHITGFQKIVDNTKDNRVSEQGLPVMTLKDCMAENGHLGQDTAISYLKVDVEGAELEAMPEWIGSGALANVRQVGVELHTGSVHLTKEQRPMAIRKLVKAFGAMYQMGFRLVDYSPNLCVGKSQDQGDSKRHYTFVDVLWYRPLTP